MKFENYSIEQYQLYKSNLDNYLEYWSLQNKTIHFIVRSIIHKVVISHINIIYYLNSKVLADVFNLIITKKEVITYEPKEITDSDCETIILPCELERVNQGKMLIIGNQQTVKNSSLIELLKRSWEWHGKIESGIKTGEIGDRENVSTSYVGKVLKLRFLSPKIQVKILKGEQLRI